MKRTCVVGLLLTLPFLLSTANLSAATISYQGQLNDANGDPVADGSYEMTFSLWTDSTGGEMLWQEPRSVSIEGGHFSIYLGQVSPITANVIGSGHHLQIQVSSETLLPRTLLGSTPSTFISERVVGDVVTDGTSMCLPGIDKATLPKALELTQQSSGGIVSIWGANGTSIAQVEMKGTATGGQLGIWGTGGIAMPQVSIGGGDNSGSLGIWGTGGTARPVVSLEASDTTGAIGLNFGVRAGDFPQVNIEGSPTRGSLELWGGLNTRANQSGIELSSDTAGRLLWVRGSDGNPRMLVYGDAINSAEILDEPGIAQSRSGSCNIIDSTGNMEDVLSVTVTIPVDGYIVLMGHGQAEFNGTTSDNRIDIQLDETAGGGIATGLFLRTGLSAHGGTGYMDFDISLQRTYFKSAGSHTFYMEARHIGSGTARVCFPTITAMFFPTSYGSVTTVAGDPGDNPDYHAVSSWVSAVMDSMKQAMKST